MKKIFISRSVKPSSPISDVTKDHILLSQSLIEFSALDFEEPNADWIFFYSRNGVKYFFKNGNYELYPYLWACMSKGTAEELSHYITDISFIGNGSPDEVAKSYLNFIQPKDVTCYVRAEQSLDSINKRLAKDSDFSIPVYSNQMSQKVPTEDFDILIFTSPMNVDAWFQVRKYSDEQIIAIGNTTANHLKDYGIINVRVAKSPSESAIAESLIQIL